MLHRNHKGDMTRYRPILGSSRLSRPDSPFFDFRNRKIQPLLSRKSWDGATSATHETVRAARPYMQRSEAYQTRPRWRWRRRGFRGKEGRAFPKKIISRLLRPTWVEMVWLKKLRDPKWNGATGQRTKTCQFQTFAIGVDSDAARLSNSWHESGSSTRSSV